MNLIPVIDLQAGQVVHAVRGERARYQPMRSSLAAGSDPLVLASTMLQASGSCTLYVADLDALQGRAPQAAVLAALLAAEPGCTLWLDAGFRDLSQACHLLEQLGDSASRVHPVFGSESLASRSAAQAALAARSHALLSLDRLGNRTLDAAGCWDDTSLWPQRVIVMTLDRVGAGTGPDLQTLAALRQRAPEDTLFIGAGGIRDAADLQRAEEAGAHGWLVASALHDGLLPMHRPGAMTQCPATRHRLYARKTLSL
jgi:phosphoribosylformimino-5-aminoimidazole carboxamide ribotide isomerase